METLNIKLLRVFHSEVWAELCHMIVDTDECMEVRAYLHVISAPPPFASAVATLCVHACRVSQDHLSSQWTLLCLSQSPPPRPLGQSDFQIINDSGCSDMFLVCNYHEANSILCG